MSVFTTTGSVDYDTLAYELLLRYSYRPELYFDSMVDVKPTNQSHKGASTRFWLQNDLAIASTPLVEDVDVNSVAMSNTFVDVPLLEYGNAVVTTARLDATSMIDINAAAANVIGFNAGVSIDTVAQTAFATAGTPRYATGSGSAITSRVTVAAANTLRAVDFRRAYAELSKANVPTFDGYYLAMLHPDVAFDIKSETGEAGWRAPHVYSSPEAIMTGEIGAFEGFRVVVSPRAPLFANSGVGSLVDVYRTLFMGREAVAKSYSTGGGYGESPVVVLGPVVDKLRRFQPLGWKHFVGFAPFRADAMKPVESSSSIGANT